MSCESSGHDGQWFKATLYLSTFSSSFFGLDVHDDKALLGDNAVKQARKCLQQSIEEELENGWGFSLALGYFTTSSAEHQMK